MLAGIVLLFSLVVSFRVFSQWADHLDCGLSWLIAGFAFLAIALVGLESCVQLIG